MPSQIVKHKSGWINIYKINHGKEERVCPGTQIYASEKIAIEKARNKNNWLCTAFTYFTYIDKPWNPQRNKSQSNA